MSYIVTFSNVGRCKATFTTQLKSLGYRDLRRAVKLCSRDVDFEIDEESRTGRIFVGGFRCVGEFVYEERPQ